MPFDKIADELLQLRARERDVHVLRAAGIGRDKRQVDLSLLRAGQLDLRFFGGFLQTLQRHAVASQVDAFLLS